MLTSLLKKHYEAEQLMVAGVFLVTAERLSRIQLYSRMSEVLPSHAVWQKLQEMVSRRCEGVPLQYLTGIQVFLEHEYHVGPGVLIPRPETEALCMTALSELSLLGLNPTRGIEIGLGSGVLSIELILKFHNLVMIASELTYDARKYAQLNTKTILGTENLHRLEIISVSDPFEVVEPFVRYFEQRRGNEVAADFLITNPPYLVMNKDEIEAQVYLYEPREALFAPADALHFYKNIANYSDLVLKKNGIIFAEVPHERAFEILALFSVQQQHAMKWNARLLLDLNQQERILVAKLNS